MCILSYYCVHESHIVFYIFVDSYIIFFLPAQKYKGQYSKNQSYEDAQYLNILYEHIGLKNKIPFRVIKSPSVDLLENYKSYSLTKPKTLNSSV